MNNEPKLGRELVESSTNAANVGNQTDTGTHFIGSKGKVHGRNTKFHCSYCGKDGHTEDCCWDLHSHF